jgi:diguanylate cyclase (GGDEF)-like protein
MSSPNHRLTPYAVEARCFGSMSGALRVGHDGLVTFANEWAHGFFGSACVGKRMEDLWNESEKAGHVSSGTVASLTAALSAKRPQHLFDTRDGRAIMLSTDWLPDDAMLLTLTDVTFVVRTTVSQQRDVLTGLANRLALLGKLADIAHMPTSAALLYVDLDRFKVVNDTLGHPVGDALLKLVAERILRLLGPDDLLARVGGDEFVILQIKGEQPHAAETLARKVIEIVGRTYLVHGHSVQVGASVGIALVAADGNSPDELIKNADLALFKAKSSGRGTFRFFTDAMDREIQARRALEIDLRRALAMKEFSLVYQPQFEIEGKLLVGFEALIRWSTPDRGSVSPAIFIPLAEEIGLIDALGEWVLRTACKDAAGWTAPLSISVNLSPLQFKNPKLVETILSALAASGLAPSRLDLEITEGALIDNTDVVVAMLRQLKELGMKVSIDDFGTGYSSLSYLQKFPFDKIKIDQSFIRSMENSHDSAAIVRAVTALGRSLGMTTIAEGVETEAQLQQIAEEGCRQVQGYLTGRPLSGVDAAALVDRQS